MGMRWWTDVTYLLTYYLLACLLWRTNVTVCRRYTPCQELCTTDRLIVLFRSPLVWLIKFSS